MRVLHVYRTYFPETKGGLQEAIRQICRGTSRFGTDNTVYTLAKRPLPTRVRIDEATVVRCRSVVEIASCDLTGFRGVGVFRQLVSDADVIHFHFPWPFGDLLHFLSGARVPAVVTYHSDIVRQQGLMGIYRPLMRRFLASMSRIVATSPNYAGSSPVLRDYQYKLEVIPLALDPSLAETPLESRVSHWESLLGRGFFLFIGVLRYYKGLHILIEAVRYSGLPVVIVGTGPEERALKRQAAGLAHIHFVGHVSEEDKFALMQLAKCIVFPSHIRSEAFGMTLLEGAMFGKPLISAEIGTGTSYVNINETTGLVVPPGDPDALGAALWRLDRDAALCAAFGEGARQRFWAHFTAERLGRAYVDLYRRLLEGRDQGVRP